MKSQGIRYEEIWINCHMLRVDPIFCTGETKLWFGAVLTGGKGYQALLKQAQEMGGDAIMDYSFDVEYESILWFIYAKGKWKATGIAIKYNEDL